MSFMDKGGNKSYHHVLLDLQSNQFGERIL